MHGNSNKKLDMIINVVVLSTRYTCKILMQLQFSRQILEKYSNIKSWKSVESFHADGQTWRSYLQPFAI